jgi:ferredoxin
MTAEHQPGEAPFREPAPEMSPAIAAIYTTPAGRASRTPVAPEAPAPPPVTVTIDGVEVSVPAGVTILEAARAQGLDLPTLCYLENLAPVNVCRVCVVEVTGSRVLVPACSRKVEPGMEIQTESERVRHSRKLVLEFLGSSVDTSLAGPRQPDGDIARWALAMPSRPVTTTPRPASRRPTPRPSPSP